MLNYCFSGLSGFVKINSKDMNEYHCLHVYIDNNKILETPYEKTKIIWINLENIPNINNDDRLSFRYFTKKGDQRNVFSEKIGKISSLFPSLINIDKENIINMPSHPLSFYNNCLQVGGENISNNNDNIYKMLCESNSNEIALNKDLIIEKISNFHENDRTFLMGVLYYRIRDFEKSKIYFNKTKDTENSFDKIGKAIFLYDNSIKPIHKFNENFTILISCDVGYLYAYKDNLISSLTYHDLLIHVHVLVVKESSIDKISNDFKDYKGRLNLTFEVLTTQDKMVYSSISRFIKAKDIIRKYNTPVLIADIDLDFSKDCVNSLKSLNLNEMGFFISENQLPWKKILAGFCYFPHNSKSLFFLENLSNYLLQMCDEDNYYWTLDQVALTNMYDSNIVSKNSFHNFKDSNVIRLKQVENRQAARNVARKFKDL